MTDNYICPNCKAEVAYGDRSCAKCGTPFFYQAKPPVQRTPPPVQKATIPVSNKPEIPQINKQKDEQKQVDQQQKPKKKRLLPTLIVLIFLAGMVAGGGIVWAAFSSSNTSAPVPQLQSSSNAIAMTAGQLIEEFDLDEAGADARYRDKLIRVTGLVSEMVAGSLGTPYIVLTEPAVINNFNVIVTGTDIGVHCMFTAKDRAGLAWISEGDIVTIEGICRGRISYVILGDCSIK
jgi:hypothetical protein